MEQFFVHVKIAAAEISGILLFLSPMLCKCDNAIQDGNVGNEGINEKMLEVANLSSGKGIIKD